MNDTVTALAVLAKVGRKKAHTAWKLAKKHATADLKRGDYVKVFKTFCKLLELQVDHLPDGVGDNVVMYGRHYKIVGSTNVTFDLVLYGSTNTLSLPLLNLILCGKRQSDIQATEATPKAAA